MPIDWTTIILAVLAVLQALVWRRAEQTHRATNSMKDELVAATKAAALLEGALVAEAKFVAAAQAAEKAAVQLASVKKKSAASLEDAP